MLFRSVSTRAVIRPCQRPPPRANLDPLRASNAVVARAERNRASPHAARNLLGRRAIIGFVGCYPAVLTLGAGPLMKRHFSIHPRGLLLEMIHRLRGREQMLVRAGEELPLVVISYPRGNMALAEALQAALCHTYRLLSPETRQRYTPVLPHLPSLVVAVLRARNPCTCLGHHHPPGTEGRMARRLSSDTGLRVGEIDLAVEAIRRWEPMPLAALAAQPAGADREEIQEFRFHIALLSVFLHELEHLAFPEHREQEVRKRSTEFYAASLREFFSEELGLSYGI